MAVGRYRVQEAGWPPRIMRVGVEARRGPTRVRGYQPVLFTGAATVRFSATIRTSGRCPATTTMSATPSGVSPPFVWLSQVGVEYANSKIVYLSPQIYGFDFGAQYAPNQGNALADATGNTPIGSTTCNQTNANCITASSGNDPRAGSISLVWACIINTFLASLTSRPIVSMRRPAKKI